MKHIITTGLAIVFVAAAALVSVPVASAQNPTPGTNSLPDGYHVVVLQLDANDSTKIVVSPLATDKVKKGDVVLFHNKTPVRLKIDFSNGITASPFSDATFKIKPSTHSENTKTLTVEVEGPDEEFKEFPFEVTGPNGEEPAPDQSPVIRVGPKGTSGTSS